MPKVSIIIPVYNVEKYLRQALDSVVNQTLKDIEIICIDDKSTDGSLEILKEYAQKDSRFVILEQETNQGPGVARNRALDIAKGEYIMFLDPDDWFELNACEDAYNQISQNNNDMVLFSFNRYYQETGKSVPDNWRLKPFKDVLNEKQINLKTLKTVFINLNTTWHNIYRREFLNKNNIRYDNSRNGEDHLLLGKAYLYSNTVSVLNERIYNYRVRNDSTTMTNPYQYKNIIRIKEELFDLIPTVTDSKSYMGVFLAAALNNIFYWYGYQSKNCPLVLRDFYNRMRKFFIYINKNIDIKEYKSVIGKRNYKKFKRVVRYTYAQHVLRLKFKKILHSIFSTGNDEYRNKYIILLGYRIYLSSIIKYRTIGMLLGWIFPTREDRHRFRNMCRDIDTRAKLSQLPKIFKKHIKRIRRKKGKIRVLFLVNENSKWKAQTLYDLMAKSDKFEPIIALTQLTGVHDGKDITRDEIDKNYKFFKSKNMNVVMAYQNHQYIDLKIFKPDIVFFPQPWAISKIQSPINVSKYALTCYIPYFVANYGADIDYKFMFHKFLFRHYVLNEQWAKEYSARSGLHNFYGVGHTILDNYYLNKHVQSKNNYVIYAPHYSIPHPKNKNAVNYGTFLLDSEFILNFAQKHPEINWVFKPHPQLKLALYNILGQSTTDKYYQNWAKIGKVCTDSSYVDLFLDSKAMITDCASFLNEYFCTGKPIIHLISSKTTLVPMPPFKKILDSFYEAHNLEELNEYLERVVLNNDDYKKDERLKVLADSGLKDNYAAQNIMEDLEKVLVREDKHE